MKLWTPDYLARLGLQAGASERDIKRAYARALKALDQTTQPEEFAQLRQDYENSLQFAKMQIQLVAEGEESGEPAPAPDNPEDTAQQSNLSPKADTETLQTPLDRVTPAPEPDPPGLAEPAIAAQEEQQAVATAFEAFVRAVHSLSSAKLSDYTGLLNHHLLHPKLQSLSARQAFEARLAYCLYQHELEMHSGPILLGAADVLGWESEKIASLEALGFEGAYLSTLLDEASVLHKRERDDWVLLAGAPDSTLAHQLLRGQPEREQKCPNLYAFFYTNEHIAKWRAMEISRPQKRPSKSRNDIQNQTQLTYFVWLRQFIRTVSADRTVVFGFGLAIALTVVVVSIGLYSPTKKVAIDPACDTTYARAMQDNWYDIPAQDVTTLETCAYQTPPVMCSDRKAMLEVLSIARQLGGTYELDGIRLRTKTGLPYASSLIADNLDLIKNTDIESCKSIVNLVNRNANWLEIGNVLAAQKAIEVVALCHSDQGIDHFLEDRLKLTFLQHLDAWPEEYGRAEQYVIPLHTLMHPPKTGAMPVTGLAHTVPAWPPCFSDAAKALAASDTAVSLGPAERSVIVKRAYGN